MRKQILFCTCLVGVMMLPETLNAQENTTMQSKHESDTIPGKPKYFTYEQMTELMVKDLQLNEKQQKKVAKLNKKYKTLIEGEQREMPNGQRPPMGERPSSRPSGGMGGPGGGMGGGFGGGMGGPGGGMGGGFGGGMGGPGGGMGMPGGHPQEASYDYDKKQEKYDKSIGKILSEQQYEKYLTIKQQFASQRRIRDFLMGGQQLLPSHPE